MVRATVDLESVPGMRVGGRNTSTIGCPSKDTHVRTHTGNIANSLLEVERNFDISPTYKLHIRQPVATEVTLDAFTSIHS